MAAVASGGHGCVVVVRVALRARHGRMCAGQRERSLAVIKAGARPGRCAMAGCACGGEVTRDVIGIRGLVEIRLVASVAISRHRCVVVVGVALRARHGSMCAGQRERSFAVIKGGTRPGRRGMARGACGGEVHLDVIGIRGLGEIRLVASVAILGQRCEIVVGVALCAPHGNMCAGQREGSLTVVKGGGSPIGSGVA